jgi:hypothetical protein
MPANSEGWQYLYYITACVWNQEHLLTEVYSKGNMTSLCMRKFLSQIQWYTDLLHLSFTWKASLELTDFFRYTLAGFHSVFLILWQPFSAGLGIWYSVTIKFTCDMHESMNRQAGDMRVRASLSIVKASHSIQLEITESHNACRRVCIWQVWVNANG